MKVDNDVDDGFGPYLCISTKRICNPGRDHCRCWWLSENPEHWMRLAELKIAGASEVHSR
jgi:hypothetical protein